MAADPEIDLTDPAGYRLWVDERVRFADLDPQGHANNNAVGVYFESARVGLWDAVGRFAGASWTVVIRRTITDFRAELRYPAEIRVGVRVLRIGTTSVTLGLGVFHGEACIATQEAVSVLLDKGTRRPWPASEDLRRVLADY